MSYIATFYSHFGAIRFKKLCQQAGIPVKVMPVPRALSSSGCTLHIQAHQVPFHPEALELARMGFIPAGAYRNREYAQAGVQVKGWVEQALEDLFYDPQTSGGLLAAVPEECAEGCLQQLLAAGVKAARIGYVTEQQDAAVCLED